MSRTTKKSPGSKFSKVSKFSKGPAVDRRRPIRRKACKFCMERLERIDFRDTARLSKFTSERGKILPRRISGNCARHQRQLSSAVKQARAVALMPYVAAE
ncbi:MAG: 30S ribosomal protein S18 [Candidatus Omnitrophica bacterium]|nr:30S ribosomal protein S18 [Candidatus Omnitrophota bacterium]